MFAVEDNESIGDVEDQGLVGDGTVIAEIGRKRGSSVAKILVDAIELENNDVEENESTGDVEEEDPEVDDGIFVTEAGRKRGSSVVKIISSAAVVLVIAGTTLGTGYGVNVAVQRSIFFPTDGVDAHRSDQPEGDVLMRQEEMMLEMHGDETPDYTDSAFLGEGDEVHPEDVHVDETPDFTDLAFLGDGDEVHPEEAPDKITFFEDSDMAIDLSAFMSMPTRTTDTPTTSPTKSATTSSSEGRLIEFTVENLDGEPGKKGTFIVLTRPDWAPIGAERVKTLVSEGFFEEVRAFRVLPGFISQFGINGDPEVQAKWRSNYLEDEPVAVSNSRGTISFASAGPGTRTTQLFINLTRNSFLNRQGFSPIGQVVEGMDVVERFYSGYGDGPSSPIQWKIQSEGNEYLQSSYPKLSYFSKVQFK
ncbi:hypothetical protein THAOC_26379 [Thalassiosira oceanica]|uniref:peptidylprolyl isomerase n=1 Tax=Thalassiosira oceanica TaxID=159749 RepID=K0RLL6_THAOC|nr:hypothetical protein THAOC_26379 [Thalassiosira oceanica]|eukprot:EJK54070.1 hypothetical protein THAOC_26379 [Thalassiosira oceanica]